MLQKHIRARAVSIHLPSVYTVHFTTFAPLLSSAQRVHVTAGIFRDESIVVFAHVSTRILSFLSLFIVRRNVVNVHAGDVALLNAVVGCHLVWHQRSHHGHRAGQLESELCFLSLRSLSLSFFLSLSLSFFLSLSLSLARFPSHHTAHRRHVLTASCEDG